MNLEFIRSNRQSELEKFISLVEVQLLSYDKAMIPYPNSSGKFNWIPRCNKLIIEIKNDSDETIEDILLTVIRLNSKIGNENFDTIPIKTYQLLPKSIGKYEISVFDAFNEKFEGMDIRISTKKKKKKRKKVDNLLNRASEFSKRIDSKLDK